jgi:hypothetical protein
MFAVATLCVAHFLVDRTQHPVLQPVQLKCIVISSVLERCGHSVVLACVPQSAQARCRFTYSLLHSMFAAVCEVLTVVAADSVYLTSGVCSAILVSGSTCEACRTQLSLVV